MKNDPFCVLGLPRSRTSWLAQFLSYGGRECRHEGTALMGTFTDVLGALRRGTGISDTMLALRAEDIAAALPKTRMLIVKRRQEDVFLSMARLGYPIPSGMLDRLSVALERASWLPNAITVRFEDLDDRETCSWIFRHCLGQTMPKEWFDLWNGVNVQTLASSVIEGGIANYDGVRAIYGAHL